MLLPVPHGKHDVSLDFPSRYAYIYFWSACAQVCVCVGVCSRFICANLSLKFDFLFKENLAAISFAGTSHSSSALGVCDYFLSSLKKLKCSFY